MNEGMALSRAAIYAMLGDETGALDELAAAQKANLFVQWWYTLELDPIFKALHGNPRFEALAANARRHAAAQHTLVDAMRKRGEIPPRPAAPASAKLAGRTGT
jgi:hypothetical protein